MNGRKTPSEVAIQLPETKVAAETGSMSGPLVPARPNRNSSRRSDVSHVVLRLLCLSTSVAALSFMATAKEAATVSIYGFSLPVFSKWSFSDSFEYLVGVSAAVAAHSVLQLLLSASRLLRKSPVIPSRNHAWLIFVGDQVFAYAMMSAGSAASGVTNLNRTGIRHSALPNFCKPLHSFCDHVAVSIAFTFFSCFLLAASAVLDVIWLSKKSFESEDREKFRADAPSISKFNVKEHYNYGFLRNNVSHGVPLTRCTFSSRITAPRWFPSGALSSYASSAGSDQIICEDEPSVVTAYSREVEFNRVNCLVWVLHESARSFSLAIQTLELAGSGPELSSAWVGVDVHAWHKPIAYQVSIYALLKAAVEVELFLSHKRSNNPSPVREILYPLIKYLEECIESQLNRRNTKLVQWFKTVEVPRIAGLFIPLFKKWSMDYAGSGIAGTILAISCCAAVRKLGPGRTSCPFFYVSSEDILADLMNFSHSLVSVDKLYHLATEAGFEQDFLSHFGSKILPCKNTEGIEFWIGLVHEKLSVAFQRESVISDKHTFRNKVQENSLATLGLFAYLGKETRVFLSGMGIKDLDEQVKDFLSYLECGSLFICPEFSSLSEYQRFMEVVTDEISWLDFYAAFRGKINHEKRRSKQHANQAEMEIVTYTVFTICYDVFSGFAHYSNSAKQPLDENLLAFLLRSQSLLSICMEDYWAAYDKSSELLMFSERDSSTPSLRINGSRRLSGQMEAQQKPIDMINRGSLQRGSKLSKVNSSAGMDPTMLGDTGSATERGALYNSFLRKSSTKLISASADIWMGTQLLFIDILDALGILMKKLQGHEVTQRERKKIQRTMADIATLIPVTILMLLPVSAVGHAAIFAAIKKYLPAMIPSPYSSERLEIVKQLKRTKKMEVQTWSTIEDSTNLL